MRSDGPWRVYLFNQGKLVPSDDRSRSTFAVQDRRVHLGAGMGSWTLAVDTPRLVVRTLHDFVQIFVHNELVDESPGRHGTP